MIWIHLVNSDVVSFTQDQGQETNSQQPHEWQGSGRVRSSLLLMNLSPGIFLSGLGLAQLSAYCVPTPKPVPIRPVWDKAAGTSSEDWLMEGQRGEEKVLGQCRLTRDNVQKDAQKLGM